MNRSAVRKDDAILQEAVDQLAKIIEIDPNDWIKAKSTEKKRFWIDITNASEINQSIKMTLHVIYDHLRKNFPAKKDELDSFSRKGFSAIWKLAQEAVDKIDQINSLFHTEITQSVRDSKEYKELEMALSQKLSSRVDEDELDLPEELLQATSDETHLTVKTLDSVKKDQQYELFFIKQEDGSPFFAPQLINNIKLLIDFEKMMLASQLQDPFISLPIFQDRLIYSLAKSIKEIAHSYTSSFMKIYHRFSQQDIAQNIYKAIIALDLAAITDNRMDAKKRKICTQYFQDFLYFLHKALYDNDYKKFSQDSLDSTSDVYRIVQTARALCFAFFTAEARLQFEEQFLQEMKAGIHPLKGHIWQRMADEYSFIHDKLKAFPSGPLMKTLDLWTHEGRSHDFNPLPMKNYPRLAYRGKHEKGPWECIHLPAPIHQAHIQKAHILKEFTEALAYMEENHMRKWVVFNLQDRTSYYESARSKALEELQYIAPYNKVLSVITLPKASEFYWQSGGYAEISDARGFIKAFEEQFTDHEISGFFFPRDFDLNEFFSFSKKLLHWMHKNLFHQMEIMHKEIRQDFIEIYFWALAAKIVGMTHPSFLSFTSKDSVDLGAADEAGFLAFLQILQRKLTLDSGNKIEILSLLPAFFQRERLLDEPIFQRMTRALATLSSYLEKEPELGKELLQLLGLKDWRL